MTLPLVVLASGQGTNLQALLDAERERPDWPARVVLVGSNVPGCPALDRAVARGVATWAADHREFGKGTTGRRAFEDAFMAEVGRRGIVPGESLLVLAGFMRIVTAPFIAAWRGRIINLHPSLLPAFPGAHAVADAFAAGVAESGCTVHFVDALLDHGPPILQTRVSAAGCASEADLFARIRAVEHPTLLQAVGMLARGEVEWPRDENGEGATGRGCDDGANA